MPPIFHFRHAITYAVSFSSYALMLFHLLRQMIEPLYDISRQRATLRRFHVSSPPDAATIHD